MATYPGQVVTPSVPVLSIGAVFARAFAAIGAMPAAFFGVAAVLTAGPSLASRLLLGSLFTPANLATLPQRWPYLVAGGIGWWLIYLLAQTLFYLFTAAAAGERRRPGAGELLVAALRVLPAAFVQSLVMTLAIPLALMILIVPGVLLWLLWAVAPASLVIERSGLFASFGRSARLTAGSRWQIVAIGMLVFAIYFVASSTMGVVSVAMVGLGAGPGQFGARLGPAQVVIAILSALLQMAFVVCWSAIKAALFLELRDLKDGPSGDRLAGIFE